VLLGHLQQERETLRSWEVIVVDDGSADATHDIVTKRFPDVRVLRHEVNRGKGAAVKTGMLSASGSYRFFIDADMPYDLRALSEMLRYLEVKEFHVCIGSRPRGAHRIGRSFLRRLTSFLATAFVSRIVVTGVRDTQCGFKGFQAETADYLFGQSRVDNFAFDVEILYLAFKNDLDVKKIPVALVTDHVSTVSVIRHGFGMLLEIFTLPFAYHLSRYQMMKVWQQQRGGGE
jgi:dolichyl-phosphate beta-glucosyltransferase